MSDQEQTKLMIQNLVTKFDQHCEYVKKELDDIKRGVHGDPANKVPGLIDRQLEDERRIKDIEDKMKEDAVKKKTAMWIVGILWAGLQAIGILLYELYKSLK